MLKEPSPLPLGTVLYMDNNAITKLSTSITSNIQSLESRINRRVSRGICLELSYKIQKTHLIHLKDLYRYRKNLPLDTPLQINNLFPPLAIDIQLEIKIKHLWIINDNTLNFTHHAPYAVLAESQSLSILAPLKPGKRHLHPLKARKLVIG